jgi:hypothetical protein
MTRIFIEGYELDLTTGISNQITYAIDDLQNLDSKSTSFTKTIILPGTANNNTLFGNIFDFNNANFSDTLEKNVLYNFNAAKNAEARIEVNGLQIMKGVLRLLEIVQDNGGIEYECSIFGELGGFINKLGNERLQDLDFSEYDHTYNTTNIVNSWDTSGSTGYAYPLIDYGNVSTGAFGVAKKDFQYTTYRPALFVREYLTKIIANAGYTFQSDFIDSAFFRRLMIPHNQAILTKNSSTQFSATAATGLSNNPVNPQYIAFPSIIVLGGFVASMSNTLFTYSSNNSITNTLTFKLKGTWGSPRSFGGITFRITKNSEVVGTYSQPYTNTILDVNLVIDSIQFSLNDKLRVEWSAPRTSQDYSQLNVTSGSIVLAGLSSLVPINLNELIEIKNVIPKGIFQKDFFTSLLKMFNLYVTEDKFKVNHLIITPYVNFWSGNILDWSNKLDRSKAIKIKPMSEINARYYNLKFKQDNDYYNEEYRKKYSEGYGDIIYDNGLEFTKDNESVEVIFANSVLYGATGTDKIYPAIYKKSNENTKEDPMDHIIRIIQVKKIPSGIASWSIMNGATELTTNTKYLYGGHIDDPTNPTKDLGFGAPQQLFFNLTNGNLSNNLFNNYYSSYLAEITDKDSRLLTAYFDLNDLDIFNLDFSKFIYIDGGLYRINKIIEYAPENNDLTKVDLLRVIQKEYIEAPLPTTTTTTTTTTTSTTTTTTTISFDACYSMVSAYDVCYVQCTSPVVRLERFSILEGGDTLCTAAVLTSPGIHDGTITGEVWISTCNGISRQFGAGLGPDGQNIAVYQANCQACPTTTTTTTTTTSTTTTTTTEATTTTTTSTTTTTTTLATFDASYSMISAYDVCYVECTSPVIRLERFTILEGGNTLCTAEVLTSPGIHDGTITGEVWISTCNGISRQFGAGLGPDGQNIAVYQANCQACPTTTTTTTTTTSTTTTTTTAATTTTTSTTTTTTTAAFYSIGWQFSKQSQSGDFSISVNGIGVVSVTSSNSGNIEVPIGASISTSVGAGASSQLIAQADLIVTDNGITIYNESTQGFPSAGESYSYTASGDGSIDATASEF